MKQAMNPYLPLYEYIPDGEPHVFGTEFMSTGATTVLTERNSASTIMFAIPRL